MSTEANKQVNHKQQLCRDVMLGSELWTDGLICAFEFVRGPSKKKGSRSCRKNGSRCQNSCRVVPTNSVSKCVTTHISPQDIDNKDCGEPCFVKDSEATNIDTVDGQNYYDDHHTGCFRSRERSSGNYWIQIGWTRISELLQTVQIDADWASHLFDFTDEEDDVTVADVAAPYWERPVGPTWWCHVAADHPFINSWLSNAQWLHPAISIALRDESRLISERMKHLLYEVLLYYFDIIFCDGTCPCKVLYIRSRNSSLILLCFCFLPTCCSMLNYQVDINDSVLYSGSSESCWWIIV